MAIDGSVEIRITGSLDSSLASSVAAAITQLDGVNAEVKNLAQEMTAAGAQSRTAFAGTFDTAASGVAEAKTTYRSFGDELQTVVQQARSLTTAVGGVATDISRIGQEAMSGDFSKIPGSVAALISRMGGLTTETIGSAGAFGALAAAVAAPLAGLGYLAYAEHEAAQNAEALHAGFVLTGRGATETKEAIAVEIDTLRGYKGVTESIAEGIIAWDAAHGEIDDRITQFVNQLSPRFVEQVGKDTPEALGQLKEALNTIATGSLPQAAAAFDKLNAGHHQTLNSLAALIKGEGDSADRFKAINAIVGELAAQGGVNIETLNQNITETIAKLKEAKENARNSDNSVRGNFISAIGYDADEATRRIQGLEDELAKLQGEKAAQTITTPKLSTDAVQKKLLSFEQDITKTDAQHQAEQVKYLQGIVNAKGNSADVELFIERTLAEKTVALRRSTSAEIVEQARNTANKLGLTGQARLLADIKADRDSLANANVSAEAKIGIQSRLDSELSQLHEKSATEASAADKHANDEALAEFRQWAEQIDQIRRDDLATSIQISKLSLEAQKQTAQEDFQNAKITAQRKYDILVDAAEKEAALDIKALTEDQKRGDITIVEYNHDADEIKLIAARLTEFQAAQARQLTADQLAELRKRVEAEKSMISQLTSAEDQLVSNIFSGNQTLTQDLIQLGSGLLQKEIADDLKYYTTRLFLTEAELAADKSAAAKGLLLHLLTNTQKTASTVESVSTQTGTVASGQVAQIGAVATGEAAQVAIKTAGAETSNAAQVTSDSKSIINDAYTAASAAFTSVMKALPFPANIIAAPLAAAGTFAAVAAFDVLSSEGGLDRVPQAAQMAILHKDETVLSAGFANPLRDLLANAPVIAGLGSLASVAAGSSARGASVASLAGSGGTSFGRGGDHFHVHAVDAVSFKQFLGRAANRRAMADFARDRARAGERV